MTRALKDLFRRFTLKFGYAVLDVRKQQSPQVLMPGHLNTTFQRLGVNCVIDVGANVGQYASMMREMGYSGRIVSIEPLPEAYATLTSKARHDPSWRTMNVALGEMDVTRELNVYASSDLSSFLAPSPGMASVLPDAEVVGTQPVVVKRLDSIIDQVVDGLPQPRIFLKLDTQGYDLRVVRGAEHSLRHVVGLQSELSVVPLYEGMEDYLEALQRYRRLGFGLTGIFPAALAPDGMLVLEVDAVFIRCPV